LGPRAGISTVLIAGAIVLLVAIAIGNNMGNRVLGQIGSRAAGAVATPVPSPSASAEDDGVSHVLWKRRQVLSVATDPAFPDPRVTPEPPPPPPTPRPTPRQTRTPVPSPSAPSDGESTVPYTSPPMPIPLVSHEPGETTPPDEGASPSVAPRASPSPTPRPGAHAGSATASPGVSTVNN
jgi:hypothetical protein